MSRRVAASASNAFLTSLTISRSATWRDDADAQLEIPTNDAPRPAVAQLLDRVRAGRREVLAPFWLHVRHNGPAPAVLAHFVNGQLVPGRHFRRDVPPRKLGHLDVGLVVPGPFERAVLQRTTALGNLLDAHTELVHGDAELVDQAGRDDGELEGVERDVKLVGDLEVHGTKGRG